MKTAEQTEIEEDQVQCVCQLGGEPSGMADPCMVCPAKIQASGCGYDGLPEGCPMAREGAE